MDSAPSEPAGPVEPSDDAVRRAVAATGDVQLRALIAEQGSYVLRRADLAGRRLRFFRAIVSNVAHPAGFLLAFDARSGRAEVTSQRPNAVAWVLSMEPELAAPDVVWELIREPSTPQRLIRAEIDETGAEGRYLFDVEQASGPNGRWRLSLSDGGQFERVD